MKDTVFSVYNITLAGNGNVNVQLRDSEGKTMITRIILQEEAKQYAVGDQWKFNGELVKV